MGSFYMAKSTKIPANATGRTKLMAVKNLKYHMEDKIKKGRCAESG